MSDFHIIQFGEGYDGERVAGVYANDPSWVGPYGTFLMFRGTPLECEKQAAYWDKHPHDLDPLLFRWRQEAVAARRNRKPLTVYKPAA